MGVQSLPPLHPQWIEATQAMGGSPPALDDTLEGSRAQFLNLLSALDAIRQEPQGSESVGIRDVQINQSLRARVYIPSRRLSHDQGGDLPIGLYIHAGGFFTGSIETEDFMCKDIALNSHVILVSPEYRLAPENPYPAGLEDCLKAYEYIHSNASDFGGNNRRKFVMGASAGGNLAACVALKYASDALLRPAGLMVSCMISCDPQALPAEYKERYRPDLYEDTPVLNSSNKQIVRGKKRPFFQYWQHASEIVNANLPSNIEWLQPPALDDPLYSPLLHPDIKLLPRVYVAAPTNDPTYQDTTWFYEECKKQGVQAELIEWQGLPHFFWALPTLQKSGEYMTTWNEKLKGMMRYGSD